MNDTHVTIRGWIGGEPKLFDKDGETAFEAELHQSVSANPYLRFYLTHQVSGEAEFSWQDDNGNTARHAAELDVS